MLNQYYSNVRTTIDFLRLLNVRVNNSTVNETLQNHPDWPSLLCISDSLNKWHIPNAAGEIEKNDIEQLPTPFLACINTREMSLGIVTQVTDTDIYLLQSNYGKVKKEARDEFLKKWNGVYLMAEPNEYSGEPDYKKNKRRSFFKALIPFATVALLALISLFLIVRVVSSFPSLAFLSEPNIYLQYFILLTGVAITSLLLWYEIDKNNPVLQRFCTGTAKINCNAILTGKQAKLFSWLSWSEIGFIYFTGGLLTLLFTGNIAFSVAIVGWLNILVAPYIFFSIYYQWKVAKQWCPLCLSVQFLLLAGATNSLFGNLLHPISLDAISANLFSATFYLLPALLWFSAKPYMLKLQNEKTTRREYFRLKFNEEIFDNLLKKQSQLTYSADGLGITLGNPAATNELIKVCNPYCRPCSEAHDQIEKLLKQNSDLKVRIIFTATNDEKDMKALPVKHLLAIASRNDEALTKKALDDWYLSNKKDYDAFAAKYPMNGELKLQDEKI